MEQIAELRPEIVAGIIGEQFPELSPVRVKYLGEGYDSTAFDVNDELVFRFPKRSDVERQLLVETRMLPLIAERAPVPVPSFSFHGEPSRIFTRHFVGYARLFGVTGVMIEPKDVRFNELAPALAGFLSSLHSFPIEEATKMGVPSYEPDFLRKEVREEALSDVDVVRTVAPDLPEDLLRSLLETDPLASAEGVHPTFVHADLSAEHILLDPQTQEITGIIDWSEMSIGDPAIDFAGIFHWGGVDFTNAVLSNYDGKPDDGLVERARYFAAARGVGDIVFGLEMKRREYVDSGIRALQLCLADKPGITG